MSVCWNFRALLNSCYCLKITKTLSQRQIHSCFGRRQALPVNGIMCNLRLLSAPMPAKVIRSQFSEQEQEMASIELGELDDSSFSIVSFQEDETSEYQREDEAKQKGLATSETKTIGRLRVIVLCVLVAAGMIVCGSFFFVTRRGERSKFTSEFKANSRKLQQAFADGIVKQNTQSLVLISSAFTSHAIVNNATWPFVTLPNFRQYAEDLMELTGILQLAFYPLIDTPDEAEEWRRYSTNHTSWLVDSLQHQKTQGALVDIDIGSRIVPDDYDARLDFSSGIANHIFVYNTVGQAAPDAAAIPGGVAERNSEGSNGIPGGSTGSVRNGPFTPLWQVAPVPPVPLINYNLLRHPEFGFGIRASVALTSIVIGGFEVAAPGGILDSPALETRLFASMMSQSENALVEYDGSPFSSIYVPVFDSFDEGNRKPVGIVSGSFKWDKYFENSLLEKLGEITVVVENTCEGSLTFSVNGPSVRFIGLGDHHEPEYTDMKESTSFENLVENEQGRIDIGQAWCLYTIHVYPTKEFERNVTSMAPRVLTILVALIFIFAIGLFLLFNLMVEYRQNLVLTTAEKSSAIVSSIFPKEIQDRLLMEQKTSSAPQKTFFSQKSRMVNFLAGGDVDDEIDKKPIADLFPHTTILFGDISGFTSWSSTREPGHVIILLQTVYQAFDSIAKKRKVLKVETIGDSYVAVAGLPNPQKQHAVIMATFAMECKSRFSLLTKRLERTLGPDTSDLGMRFGIHSGPVTAGVLRGDRARFQLFGDSVNFAARMESTGLPNCIQCSHTTAELLQNAGKDHWLTLRESSAYTRGKGVLQTYWVMPSVPVQKEVESSTLLQMSDADIMASMVPTLQFDEKQKRLIDWLVTLIAERLRAVIAKRKALGLKSEEARQLVYSTPNGKTCLDEVKEYIELPKFNTTVSQEEVDAVTISQNIKLQIRVYVGEIAKTYRSNPFHNFEHAAHVTMVVDKFLKRIIQPDVDYSDNDEVVASNIHDYTHGINSDPITILAIVMSALCHDSDHPGCSNMQLAKEDQAMADLYRDKSIAEQNSLDLSWNLLMEQRFDDLRVCMFGNREDMMRFRQVLVNVVLATDELNDLRKSRWEKAFNDTRVAHFSDLRATIVIEHIIQASDVSHTMQHWHIYQKWNQRLFHEMYAAYEEGRMGKDPSTFWYKGELRFFDKYVIPLAKKLKECNVFGVSSYECLSYALQNRAEWEIKGEEIVNEMMRSSIDEHSE